jgi:FkbM family methyltransferase
MKTRLSIMRGDKIGVILPETLRMKMANPQETSCETLHACTATVGDIASCFRLLLGRPPNAEEWAGHSAQAGMPLASVVGSYLRSLEFANRNLFRDEHSAEISLFTLEGFQLYADRKDAAVGRQIASGGYEPEVTSVFRRFLVPGMMMIDIGANIGYFSMLAASIVGDGGRVLAIEPNPLNARLLGASRIVNGFAQITVCPVAAGREVGMVALHSSYSNGTTSRISMNVEMLLAATIVPSLPVERLVCEDRKVDFIKIDVEGAEYNALLGCAGILARDQPVIVCEFSPDLMPGISHIEGPAYLRWLIARNYRLSVIEPDGRLTACGDETAVMAAYTARGTDHLDLVGEPNKVRKRRRFFP